MIKCEVIKEFTLERFNELKNIVRKKVFDYEDKKLYLGDTFECDKDMCDYLMGSNDKGKTVIRIIEIVPEVKILSQSPIEELEKSINIKSEITTVIYENDVPKTEGIDVVTKYIKDESENIIPLTNKEELDKLGKAILKATKPKTIKKKSSKK